MANYSDAHICQCFTRLTTARRRCTVTINGQRRKNGLQFVEGVMAVSYWLLQLGIKPGDVVSISALNCDLYLEWMLAIAFVGGIAAPLNYRWSLEEAKSAMEVARPVLLVTDSCHGYWHSRFNIDCVTSLVWHVLMDTPGKAKDPGMMVATELLKEPSGRSGQLDYQWAPKGAAILCFTSGTTGRPKAVTISHSALVIQSLAKIAVVGYDENDVYLHTSPLCHIGGISSALAMLMAGGCHVMIPKFEASLASQAIEEHRVSTLITVPTIMADLIAFHRTRNFESVKKILNGGGGLSAELMKDANKLFPRAKLLSAYGMTEACSSLTFLTLYDPNKENSRYLDTYFGMGSNMRSQGGTCVGKPAPHVELKLLYSEESESVPVSVSAGRILMRGPHAMLGYWDGQTPSNTLDPAHEGWFDTGDVGRIDNHGNLWLVGRAKDRIKSGGENIYPAEVEAVLSQHPGISSIVVVGVPDSRLTEMVVACVRAKDGWRWVDSSASLPAEEQHQCLSDDILRHFCREKHLTGFKIPKRFLLWRSTFPMTTTGKLRRDRVREGVIYGESFSPSKL